MRFFKNLKDQHHMLSLEKESMSIGPLWPKLRPCKDGNRQTISSKFETSGWISSIHVQILITLAWNEIQLGVHLHGLSY